MLFNVFELIYVIYLAMEYRWSTTWYGWSPHWAYPTCCLMLLVWFSAHQTTHRPSCIIPNWPVGAECGLLFLGWGFCRTNIFFWSGFYGKAAQKAHRRLQVLKNRQFVLAIFTGGDHSPALPLLLIHPCPDPKGPGSIPGYTPCQQPSSFLGRCVNFF